MRAMSQLVLKDLSLSCPMVNQTKKSRNENRKIRRKPCKQTLHDPTPCYGNQDELRPEGPLAIVSYAEFTYLPTAEREHSTRPVTTVN